MARAARFLPSFKKAVAEPPKLPDELAYLYLWYMELRGRNVRGQHVEPVPYTEILAYSTLHVLEIDEWEVDILCRLDALWLSCLPEPETPSREQ